MKKRNTTYRLNKVDYAIFIIFSIAAAAMLYLFYRDLNSFTIKQSEEPVAKIYFKRNTAQRKFVDNDIWEVLTNSSDIYDGDRIRTSKNSEAYTEFTDSGFQIQLREKSMVQIFKSKKQRSVDFIGGEIFVANNSPDETLVIHSGKKEISVSKESEVKLALPEVSEAVAAGEEEPIESTVVVEVVSGQVEIEDKAAAEPIIVSAGETVTLVPVVEESVAAVAVAPVEEVVESPVEIVAEENPELVVEKQPEPAAEPVAEKSAVLKAPTVTESKSVEEPAAPVEIPSGPQPIKAGVGKTVTASYANFKRSVYNPQTGQYNYSYGFELSKATAQNMTVPEGAVIEITLAGVSDKDLSRFAIQISTGEEEWKQAHLFKETILNNGAGIKKDVAFEVKNRIVITSPIVNTDSSWVNISYEPSILDESINIRSFDVSFKVVASSGGLNPKKVVKGYTKTLEYDEVTLFLDKWGEGPDDFDYRLRVDLIDIFTEPVILPQGTKIKISMSGSCNTDFNWCFPEFFYIVPFTDREGDEWRSVLLPTENADYYRDLRFADGPAQKNTQLNYSREYPLYQAISNTDSGYFQFTPARDGVKQQPTFKNLKFTFEVVEVGE